MFVIKQMIMGKHRRIVCLFVIKQMIMRKHRRIACLFVIKHSINKTTDVSLQTPAPLPGSFFRSDSSHCEAKCGKNASPLRGAPA